MTTYFDASVPWQQLAAKYPGFAVTRARYDGPEVRKKLLANSGFRDKRLVRFLYRPFDSRWLYWEPDHKLLNEARRQLLPYWENVESQCAFVIPQTPRRKGAARPLAGQQVAAFECAEPNARVFPLYRPSTLASPESGHELPLDHPDQAVSEPTMIATAWVDAVIAATGNDNRREAGENSFYALLAVLNSPAFVDTLPVEMDDFPQVPLPSQAGPLMNAAKTGRKLAELYDPDSDVPGVTTGRIDPMLAPIGVPDAIAGDTRLLYGSYGEAGCRRVGSDITWDDEHGWRNVPDEVWNFTVNGHTALPKWLSYRKYTDRHPHQLTAGDRERFMYLARRVAMIIRLQPDCDAAWVAAVAATLHASPQVIEPS